MTFDNAGYYIVKAWISDKQYHTYPSSTIFYQLPPSAMIHSWSLSNLHRWQYAKNCYWVAVISISDYSNGSDIAAIIDHLITFARWCPYVPHLICITVVSWEMWEKLSVCVCAVRGVWHDAESHPGSWELDPTEGPCRIRCRLQRCHLHMKPQFLLPETQHKLGMLLCLVSTVTLLECMDECFIVFVWHDLMIEYSAMWI